MPLSGPSGRINGNASDKESAECKFVCDSSTGASISDGSSTRLSVSCNSTASSSWTTPLALRSPSSSACQIHFSHGSFFVPKPARSSVTPESITRSSARVDATHEAENRRRPRTLEAPREREESFGVREPLRAVEVRGDDRHVLRFVDGETKQILDRIMMTAIDQLADQLRRAFEQFVLVVADERDLRVMAQRGVKPSSRGKAAHSLTFTQQRRTAQRKQRVIRKPAERRTQNGRERDLVGLVIEKAQQLNEVGDLLALVKAAAEHGLIRNVRAPENRFVNRDLSHRAKQQRDVAVLDGVWSLRERENATRQLLRVEHARILFGARVVFERRLGRHQHLDECTFIAQLAFRLTPLVLHVTKLVQVFVLTRRHVERHLKQTRA